MTQLLFAVLLAVSVRGVRESDARPRMPYFDWAACPFECCTYRDWTAVRATPVLKSRRSEAVTLFTIKAGETIQAITGVVVTIAPGIIKVHEPVSVGDGNQVHLQPGDEFFMLHYQGEGYGLFWAHGKTFSDQLWQNEPGFAPGTTAFEVTALPRTEWWIEVRNKKGQTGWTHHPEDYDGADACG